MSGPAWFTPHVSERHEIAYPGLKAELLRMKKSGSTDEALAEFEAGHTAWVEVRGLTAGDRALLDEMKFVSSERGGGAGVLEFTESKIRTVTACLSAWSFDLPVTEGSIRSLNPFVLDAIFEVIPEGRFLDESERANGSGPPPVLAAVPAPVPAKESTQQE